MEVLEKTQDNLVLRTLKLFTHKEKIEGIFFAYVRSSRSELFCKKDVLENFAKFTWKHLCQSLFFNKVAGLFS